MSSWRDDDHVSLWRRTHSTQCQRGHALTGYNGKPSSNISDTLSCRACLTAFQWAKKHRLFNDDPRTIEHANRLYAHYVKTGGSARGQTLSPSSSAFTSDVD